ncbi:hypothetical protein JM83_1553 [Gillisia sp. Hel_I_86]|uniref:hypothetical protein n=1 Tax=Gillisia sp. Hel_I_86 TaxID=1249981 RepID=UPI00119C8318|nr:hypothetical protein [Gillisia sp. Hel_I_86]TVZ26578.1 hypothetical protein JM83_1553 [Gillisia sp. Hel_I_86]
MKKLLLLICLISAFNINAQTEKDSLLKRDADNIISELRFMYNLDQGIRKYLDYGTLDKHLTDSIESLSEEQLKKAEKELSLTKPVRNEIFKNFLNPIDTLNTDRMIEIIEKYGFPSLKRLKKYSDQKIEFSPYIILIHTPFSYKNRMIEIIEREYKAGNMKNICQYGYILWHLNGRSDFSYMTNNGYKMSRKDDGTFSLESSCK